MYMRKSLMTRMLVQCCAYVARRAGRNVSAVGAFTFPRSCKTGYVRADGKAARASKHE